MSEYHCQTCSGRRTNDRGFPCKECGGLGFKLIVLPLRGEVACARELFDAVQEYILNDNLQVCASAGRIQNAMNGYRRIALTQPEAKS